MNKPEFLQQLEQELAGVPIDEKVAAMQYYNEYFDDAGPEQEENVIKELGSPQKIAKDIRAASGDEGWFPPEKEEEPKPSQEPTPPVENIPPPINNSNTWQNPPYQQPPYSHGGYKNNAAPPPYQQNYQQPSPVINTNNNNIAKIIVAVLLVIFLFPVATGLFAGLVGLLIGSFVTLATFLCLPFILGLALTVSGIGFFITSLILFPASLANGILLMGLSLLFVAAGLGLCVFGVFLFTKVLPPIFHSCVSLTRKIFTNLTGFFKKLFS